jgi:hypothetical protein
LSDTSANDATEEYASMDISRLSKNSPPEMQVKRNTGRLILTGRSAGILGASLLIALCTAGLTYVAVGGLTSGEVAASVASAAIAAVTAFAAAVRFLDTIVE